MQITLSSKGQIVLPAPMRRVLGLRTGSKVSIEERDGGIFIQPARKAKSIVPIRYLPLGSIKMNEQDYELNLMAGEDDEPQL